MSVDILNNDNIGRLVKVYLLAELHLLLLKAVWSDLLIRHSFRVKEDRQEKMMSMAPVLCSQDTYGMILNYELNGLENDLDVLFSQI